MVYEEAHVNQYLGFNFLYRGDINKPSLLVGLLACLLASLLACLFACLPFDQFFFMCV